MLQRRTLARWSLGLALAGTLAGTVAAQDFPSRPVRLVVPFPAGGGTDVMARALGEGLSRNLGQSVVVDNKAGAGTVIGNDAVAQAPPDGHTLLLTTSAVLIVPSLYPKLPYAPSALAPVMLLGVAPNVAVVRAESPMRSGKDLLEQARARPGRISYASAGNGTTTHLAAELLKTTAGISMVHVPYRGASPAVTDLLAGQVDVMSGTLPSVAPFLKSGKLRALGVTSGARSPLLPEVPTFAEAGVTGYAADVLYGVYTTAGLPDAALERLVAGVRSASQTEAFRRLAEAEGLVLTLQGPAEAQRLQRAEEAKWAKVTKSSGITAD
ncbi:tripartite tricarboxylate transporter substrate binding protein [Pseudacidovorax intermedius]|uniref:Bug family tripartite tricarboxylate transporter substrate binding protein n=1 Tax=Pseudacidovorax intermedius TaxID=433924 RepID=UPI0026EEF0D8|nr:tripartite tricarboxylate transporter substrate binding protein [Pseudacidovorax intermedius]